jgi:hypothetical protein
VTPELIQEDVSNALRGVDFQRELVGTVFGGWMEPEDKGMRVRLGGRGYFAKAG